MGKKTELDVWALQPVLRQFTLHSYLNLPKGPCPMVGSWKRVFRGYFCIPLFFCPTGASLAQNSPADSLLHLVGIAQEDTHKVSLLLALSRAYTPTDRPRATAIAREAQTLAERLNDTGGLAKVYHRLGTICRIDKQYDSAIVYLKRAEQLFAATNNTLLQAEMWLDIGRCYSFLGKTSDAIAAMDTSRVLCLRLIPHDNPIVDSLAKRGVLETYHYWWYAYYLIQDYTKGLDVLKEVEPLHIKYRGRASPNLFNNFGVTYRMLGEYDKAVESYFKGLELAIQQGSLEDQHRFHGNIASVYSLRGEYAKAREHLVNALDVLNEEQNTPAVAWHIVTRGLAHTRANLGEIDTKLGRYADALEHYLTALKLFEMASTPLELADFLVRFTEHHLHQSDYANATSLLERALGLYRRINNDRGVSNVLYQLGKIAVAEQNLDKALEYHAQSLDLRKRGTDKRLVAVSGVEMGNVLLLMAGQTQDSGKSNTRASLLDSAASMFRHAMEISRDIRGEPTIADCLLGLGRIEMLRGNWSEAADYLERSAAIDRTLGQKRDLYETYALLAEISAKMERHDKAYRYHQLYAAFKDSVFNETSSKQLKETQARYDTEKKDLEITSLNQQNEIAALRVKQQELALRQAELEAARKESNIRLLGQEKELQQQELVNAKRSLNERALEAKAREAELDAARAEQLLQEHDLQEQRLITYGSVAFVVLLVAFGIVLFSRFSLRKELDKRNAILEERRRISSDMHDDLGSSLSTIALLSQVMKQHAAGTQDRTEVEKISNAAQQSLEKMSEIVWSLNPRNDTLENLIVYIRKYAVEYFENSPVACDVTITGTIPHMEISGEQRRNVFLTVKEALHNIIKHSGATQATVAFDFVDHTVSLSIHDNGVGMDVRSGNTFGNGLINMQRRMKEAGGEVCFENENGTTVKLRMPVG